MPLHPARRDDDAGADRRRPRRSSPTPRPKTRRAAMIARRSRIARIPKHPVHDVERPHDSRARPARSRCGCSGRRDADRPAGARVVPRRRLGDRQPRHARPARAASCATTPTRSSCRSTTGSRPRRSSRPRSTTASPRTSGSLAHAAELGGDPRAHRDRRRQRGRQPRRGRRARRARAAACRSPKLQLLVYPVTDYEFDSPAMIDNAKGYFLEADEHALVLRPLRARRPPTSTTGASRRCARPISRGLAPAVVVTAEYDPLRDQGEAYAARLRDAGVPTEVRARRRPDPRLLRDARRSCRPRKEPWDVVGARRCATRSGRPDCRCIRRRRRSATLMNATEVEMPPERRRVADDAHRLRACYLAMAGGEPEPVFAVEDRDADGVPVRVYRPSPDAEPPGRRRTSTAAAGRSAASSSSTRSRARSRTRRARSSCRSSTGSRPSTRSRRRSTTAGTRSSGRPKHAADVRRRRARGSRSMGDSAGGNLAAVCALLARDAGGPDLALQVLVYPVADCDFDTASYDGNGEGYLLEAEQMQWFFDCYTRRRHDRPHRLADLAAARARSARRRARGRASPPSTTRCATRARRTPTGCATRASPSSSAATTA